MMSVIRSKVAIAAMLNDMRSAAHESSIAANQDIEEPVDWWQARGISILEPRFFEETRVSPAFPARL